MDTPSATLISATATTVLPHTYLKFHGDVSSRNQTVCAAVPEQDSARCFGERLPLWSYCETALLAKSLQKQAKFFKEYINN